MASLNSLRLLMERPADHVHALYSSQCDLLKHTPAVNYRQFAAPSELWTSTAAVFLNMLRHTAYSAQ
jgi:hypothetical protein